MSYGSTAYASFVRIHLESGQPTHPAWTALPHLGRMAWEAAAQAVAQAVLPASLNPEPPEDPAEAESRDGTGELDGISHGPTRGERIEE